MRVRWASYKDADDFSADDDIGRAVIELGSLRPHTVYDCWLPLQKRTFRFPGRQVRAWEIMGGHWRA